MTASAKKRQWPRFKKSSSQQWRLEVNESELITRNIADVSATGMAFKAPHWFRAKEGQKLKLVIKIQHNDPIDCEGHVVWSQDTLEPLEKSRMLGIRFDQILNFEGVQTAPSKMSAATLHNLDYQRLANMAIIWFAVAALTAALISAAFSR